MTPQKHNTDMRKNIILIIGLLSALLPPALAAQNNIKSAYDSFINRFSDQITKSHTLDRDFTTQVRTGQSDCYSFVIPAKDIKYVDNIVSAFNKDSQKAYLMKSGNKGDKFGKDIRLSTGETDSKGILINERGYNFVYALFLAPKSEDPDGEYRYAYGMKYKDEGDQIIGKFFVTYATTLNQRQKQEANNRVNKDKSSNVSQNKATSPVPTGPDWFESIMSCVQNYPTADPDKRIAIVTKIFRLVNDMDQYPDVTPVEKKTVRDILFGLISGLSNTEPPKQGATDKKTYQQQAIYNMETVIRALLMQSINALK